MKFVANILLVIFFVVLFIVALLAGALKFQLLDFNFWQNTFQKQNVYQNLATASKNSLESQIGKEGGSKVEAKIFTDLITTDNVKDFVNKNIQNILSFANGKSTQIIVYLPLKILPKNLLPKNLNGIQSEMPLKDLLTKFNYQNYQSLPLQNLSRAGRSSSLAFFCSVSLLLVVLILLVILVQTGGRLIAPGVALFLSGIFTLLVVKMAESLTSLSSAGLATNPSFAYILAGNLIPPLINEVMTTWSILGIVLLAMGIVLFFVKKPR